MTKSLPETAFIRERMREIRLGLPQQVKTAQHDVKQLTDWKFYVRSYPAVILPLISLASFAIVPKKAKVNPLPTGFLSHVLPASQAKQEAVEKKSIWAAAFTAVAAMALKSATSFAITRATGAVNELVSARSAPKSQSTHSTNGR